MTIPETKEKEDQIITPKMKELVYELKRAAQAMQSNYGRCKEIVIAIVNQGHNDGMVDLQIRQFLEKSLTGIMDEKSIRRYMPKELRLYKTNWTESDVVSTNQIEQTSTDTESDDIDETHDERSENKINDAVRASMNISHHNEDLEEGINPNLVYDYKGQKEENKIRLELKQDIEKLREELKEKEGINELLKREIEESKNQSGMLATDSEEIIKQLKIENEQLRHALTKRSFETAKEMEDKQQPDKTEEIHNLTNYIKQIEEVNTERYKEIQKLNQQIDSFSRLDTVVEPQPLELDLTDNSGYLAKFFSYRGRRVWMVHDGQKIINVKLGGEIKKK